MATLDSELDVLIKRNVPCQFPDVDDVGELEGKRPNESAPLPIAVSATSEDYVEERYKVDRRKLEQMIQGKKCKTKQSV